MTFTPPDHIHISEREPDGSWEDCTWDSGLEWYRLTYDASKPATHTEAQLLRKASGEPATGGSNLGDLAKGIKVRYGTTIPARISGIGALKTALTPGKAAVIQGSMKAFGPDHRLSKWDRNFDSSHAVCLINWYGTLLWCDPEAPKDAAVPVVVTWAEVTAFVNAFGGQHVVARIKNLGDAMPDLITYLPGYTANVSDPDTGANVRSAPSGTATLLRTVPAGSKEAVTLTGTVKGTVDPANGSDVWYTWWKNNRWEYTAKDNIVDLKAPAGGTTDCSAAVDAATAPLKATIAAQGATISNLNAQVADLKAQVVKLTAQVSQAATAAVAVERERIRRVLGL